MHDRLNAIPFDRFLPEGEGGGGVGRRRGEREKHRGRGGEGVRAEWGVMGLGSGGFLFGTK